MRVVAVMPTYRRKKMTLATVLALRAQSLPPEAIVVVGSERGDIEAANEAGAYYVDYPNEMLSWKIQAGIDYARGFFPDALMLCGSDDFFSRNWIEALAPKTGEFDMVGHGICHLLLLDGGVPEVWRLNVYAGTSRSREPIGTGRLFSRRILDKLDWKLYPEGKPRGCDAICHAQVLKAGGSIHRYEGKEVNLLCPKGGWEQINGWEAYAGARSKSEIGDPRRWLNRYFPGVAEFLLRMRKDGKS